MTTLSFEILKVGHCRQNQRLACRTAPWRTADFPALVALLKHPAYGMILFDTGYARRFNDATEPWPERIYRWTTPFALTPDEELPRQLLRRAIPTASIATVIVSHFHADHICGLGDFQQARFVCSNVGLRDIASTGRFAGVRRGLLPQLLPTNFEERARFIEDCSDVALPPDLAPFERGRDIMGDGSLLAVDLPGHAAGQFGVAFLAADGRRVFLIADGAFSMRAIRENALPMWLAGTLLGHSTAYADTIARLHALHRQNPDVLIIPAHCTERTQEFVR